MSKEPPVIVRFGNDLRLADNPALTAAAETGQPVVPLYVLDERIGGAGRWWLHHSLTALAKSLSDLGSPLVLRRGEAEKIVLDLARDTGATQVFWAKRYGPGDGERATKLTKALGKHDIAATETASGLLHEPDRLQTKTGGSYHVFTPFWRAVRSMDPGAPVAAPKALRSPSPHPASDRLADWQLLPTKPDWATGFGPVWQPGEAAAQARLKRFLDKSVGAYAATRNRPDRDGTSALSPHLYWGEISPRQIWTAVLHAHAASGGGKHTGPETFLSEVGWREFSHHLLFHHPDLDRNPIRPEFAKFPWDRDAKLLHAWQRGRTGYPIVDAGMRQLWQTGWMHNRVRMVVASFLTKHLLQPWQQGAAWFMDTLVDGDPASNSANWQWVAGCGADAAPYFRIFNPILQGLKFDPEGDYVRRWVPELKRRPADCIHQPLAALESFGDYPQPLIEHAEARARALEAYSRL